MDTVSVEGMEIPPFVPQCIDGRMYGRGACDTKGGLAAMLHAFIDYHASGSTPPCDILLACVVDEEHSFRGVVQLCEGLRAVGAVVAEPTDLRLATASKGVLRWRVVTHGVAAHSSKTYLGKNAIHSMSRVLDFFEHEQERLENGCQHPLLGCASVNVGCIRGGVQVNFVPDRCEIEIDRRLLPSEEPLLLWNEYSERLLDWSHAYPGLDIEVQAPDLMDPAWSVDPSSSVVAHCRSTLREIGGNDEMIGVPFGSDASKLGRAGIDTVIFGPGSIDQAHAAVEFVEIAQVQTAYEFYYGCLQRLSTFEMGTSVIRESNGSN